MARIFAIAFFLTAIGCGSKPEFEPPPPTTTRLPSSSDAPFYDRVNETAFELLQDSDVRSDMAYSPVATAQMLAVLMNGASNKTRDELLAFYELTESNKDSFDESQRALLNQLHQNDGSRFSSGAALFAVKPVLFDQGFVYRMGATFDASVQKLGGATIEGKRLVDEWATRRSGGRIASFDLKLSKEQELLALTVAAYSDSFKQPSTVSRFGSDDVVDAVRVYGEGSSYSIVFLVPKPQITLDVLLHDLHATRWNALLEGMTEQATDVTVPSFEIDSLVDLSIPAKAWHIRSLFNSDCNLRPMSIELERGFSLTSMLQRTSVRIEGSQPGTSSFVVSAPFVFAVVENKTGAICVIGVKHD